MKIPAFFGVQRTQITTIVSHRIAKVESCMRPCPGFYGSFGAVEGNTFLMKSRLHQHRGKRLWGQVTIFSSKLGGKSCSTDPDPNPFQLGADGTMDRCDGSGVEWSSAEQSRCKLRRLLF